mgnify:FL=1
MIAGNFMDLSNPQAECKFALWGANLLSYRPHQELHDVFWVAERNSFGSASAIRGGVPVCWPRFAVEELNNHLPRHGIARTSYWQPQRMQANANRIMAEFILNPAKHYAIAASATMRFTITDKLTYTLETFNRGKRPFKFSESLHCYFNVSSIDNITIAGLDGLSYASAPDGSCRCQQGDLKINGEIDAIFEHQSGALIITDPEYQRRIIIEKEGSSNTVVWNPAKDLPDMTPGQYKHFVCVEPANVGANHICLQPGQTHQLSFSIQVEKL